MKYDATTAHEIALRGMTKMQTAFAEGKYSVENLGNGKFIIRKACEDREYRVSVFVNPENRTEFFGTCSCPFCDFGRENTVCKHILFCHDLIWWEEVGQFTRAIVAESLQAERDAENAHYDAMEAEWAEGQAYRNLCADANRRYPTHTTEREDFLFDAIV